MRTFLPLLLVEAVACAGLQAYRSTDHTKLESVNIRNAYPDRIPVIVEKARKSHIADMGKRRFLVPSDLTVTQFIYIIRQRIQLPPHQAMLLFMDKARPAVSATLGSLYAEYKREDGYLYVYYGGEDT